MTAESGSVAHEAAKLITAAHKFWPVDRLQAIRMAKQSVQISEHTGQRSPERCRLLLDRLAVAAETTEEA